MSKTYQIKMTAPKVEAKTLDATPGTGKAPITLKAEPGARYHLTDTRSGFAPDNIRISRSGKNLKIFTDGVSEPTFIVEDFYEQPADNRAALTGKSEDGNNYEYIPENASGTAAAPVLKDDGQIFGMALGGEVINAGAAVGLLAPVAAFNPLLLAGGALGAAAAGGGGGGDGGSTASTVYAKLGSADTGPQGDNITKDQTPSIVGKATPKSTVTVTVNGKEYTGTADDSGNFEIPVTDDLPQGRYVPKVVAKLNGTTTDNFEGTPFIIDLSPVNNIDNSNGADPAGKVDPNANVLPNIVSINVDSGDTTDFYTNKGGNKGLKFLGTATGMAIDSQDWIELTLTQSDKTVLKDHVKPDKNGNWSWDKLSTDLVDGKYTLSAQVVDGAGNAVGTAKTQPIVIDTSSSSNIDPSDGSKGNDPNVNASIAISAISDDSGPSAIDFVTNDHTLMFKGSVSNFTNAGYGVNDRVLVQILDSNKAVKISGYATLTNGSWTLDSTATTLPNGNYTIKAAIVDKADNVIVAAKDQAFTIQDQVSVNDINKNASGSVSSVTDDDGWLSNDFVTSDTTPTVNGTVKDFTPNGDKVLVQILDKDGKPVAETYADPVSGKWVFNTTTPLPDGNYTIQPAIVDQAGNIVKTIPPQPLLIDSNTKLKLAITSMTDDTGTASDWITKDTQPVFTGNFGTGKTWTPNNGVFLAQIYDSAGKLVGSYGNSVIAADGASWATTANGINLTDGHYTLRTSIKAGDGQIHDVAEKQFTIDTAVAYDDKDRLDGHNGTTLHYNSINLKLNESIDYVLRENISKSILRQGKFDGTAVEITSLVTKDYLGADVELILTDVSGNTKIIDLASNYFLDPQTTLTFGKADNFSNQTTDFNTLSTYKLSAKEDLDLTTLIPTNPATATSTTTGSQIIVNDLNMTDASAQAVTISLNDVLQLGSTNAFDKSGNYSGDLQMRVSGAANDTVRLYSSDGWKLLANTVVQLHDDPSNAAITHGYRVYTDSTGRVDLFIQEQITQVNFL